MRLPGAPRRRTWTAALFCAWGLVLAASAVATPYDFLSVGDPIEDELRILDLLSSAPLKGRIDLPHLATRPLQLDQLQGSGPPLTDLDRARGISMARLERALERDATAGFTPHPLYRSTPRVLQHETGGRRVELSTGISGRGELDRHRSLFVSGSGWETRGAVYLDRWLAYSRFVVGRFDSARVFSDTILPDNDLVVLTEETYLSYNAARGVWGVQFGHTRWHWGPGDEGSLVLSKTSPAYTGLAFRVRIEDLRLDAIALSATLEQASGEQLAAHRLEWQPFESLRVGVTEAARYRWPGWQPLYFLGAIPYVLVQRLQLQSEPDSLRAHRNNIITSFDAGWRIAEGARVYGEILIDDLHAESRRNANKYAFQVGWEGVGTVGDGRLTWGGEYTRLTRFVYTSFFGRDYAVQERPLGFPSGPDARRLRIRTAWDPNPDWQVGVVVIHHDQGENEIDEPFVPGRGRVNSAAFEGVVETTRQAELTLRWWPASGVDVTLAGGYRWVENPRHAEGTRNRTPTGALTLRLRR